MERQTELQAAVSSLPAPLATALTDAIGKHVDHLMSSAGGRCLDAFAPEVQAIVHAAQALGLPVEAELLTDAEVADMRLTYQPPAPAAEWVRPGNPYDAACDRYNRAAEAYPLIKARAEQMIRDADAEVVAATAGLRQYETQPGIAMPEYR